MLLKCICPDDNGYKLFKFFNMWTEHQDYKKVVENVWKFTGSASPLQRVATNLCILRHKLRKFNRDIFWDIDLKYREADREVTNAHIMLLNNPNSVMLVSKEKEALDNFALISSAYEKFLHQKSTVTKLKMRDEGMGYFHASEAFRTVFFPM